MSILINQRLKPIEVSSQQTNLVTKIINSAISFQQLEGLTQPGIICCIISRNAFSPIKARYFGGKESLLGIIFMSDEVPIWLQEYWFWHEMQCEQHNCLDLYKMENVEIEQKYGGQSYELYLQCRIDMLEDIISVDSNHPQIKNLELALNYFKNLQVNQI